MAREIILSFENELDEKYKKWTAEIAREFVKTLSDKPGKFRIVEADKYPVKKYGPGDFAKAKAENPDLNLDEESFKRRLLADGTLERSPGWYVRHASPSLLLNAGSKNGGFDLHRMDGYLKGLFPKNERGEPVITPGEPIILSVFRRKGADNLLGVGSNAGVMLSAPSTAAALPEGMDEKTFFKSILLHELGHTFEATKEGRGNVELDGGWHCKCPDCLMNKDPVGQVLKKKKQIKFCAECVDSMKDYFDLVSRHNSTEIHTGPAPEPEPGQRADPEFKKAMRRDWKAYADAKGEVWREDLRAANFKATLTRADGTSFTIEAADEKNLYLSANDKDGNEDIPAYDYFLKIAKDSKAKGSAISFGDIRDAEFKARLLLACQEAGASMAGAPKVEDLLDGATANSGDKTAALSDATKAALEKLRKPSGKPAPGASRIHQPGAER